MLLETEGTKVHDNQRLHCETVFAPKMLAVIRCIKFSILYKKKAEAASRDSAKSSALRLAGYR